MNTSAISKKVLFLVLTLLSLSVFSQKTGLRIGDKAPELAFKSPEGKLIKLSDLKGKMVLIDFWASWCGPCRRENPNVVKAYNEYKDKNFKNGSKGFTIYGVSLDKNKASWQNAINRDKLVWPYHVSDLKQWRSKAAKIYNVRGIPTNYLIDGDGIIIAKSLRGAALDEKLQSLVKIERSPQAIEKDIKNTFTEYIESLEKVINSGIDTKSNAYKTAVKKLKEAKKLSKKVQKWN